MNKFFILRFNALIKFPDIVDYDALYKTFKGDREDLALKKYF